MSKPPSASPLHVAEERPSPLPEAPRSTPPVQERADRPLPPPASFQTSLQKTNSGGRGGALTTNLGYSLRFLLRELDDSIPRIEEPEINVDSTNREASVPASPLRSPVQGAEFTTPSENSPKSSEDDEPVFSTRLKSVVEGTGSPIGYTKRSPEKRPENHVAVSVPELVGGSGRGKVLRMESGVVRRAALRRTVVGLRVSELILCLISFSVMAANRTSGWAGDYFDRYQEYRYCFSVNVIAFAYSTFQLYLQFHHRIWKRHILSRLLRYSFDFLMDQVLAYLLISASSAAATLNDDWVSMFGSDRFTNMMIGSIAMSFFAFLALSISSVISAYKLFSLNP